MPAGRPRAYALFAHCFTCSKDIKAALVICRGLAERGIATLRFDFTGLGESDGEFADSGFSSNVADIVMASNMMSERFQAPAILVGHSLGGAAVLAAAHRLPEVRAVATIGAPCDPAHVRQNFKARLDEIEAKGAATVELAGQRFRITRDFLGDLEDRNQEELIRSLDRALLIFHSPDDAVVGIDNARHIYEIAHHPKSFVSLDGADHLLSRTADADYVSAVLAAWASRYLPEEEIDKVDPDWVTVANAPGHLACEVRSGTHRWIADEPESVQGGADGGPDPYGLLLAGLGSCTAMTLRMYANHKGLELGSVQVALRHQRIHASDCEDCEHSGGRIDEIERHIKLDGDLSSQQRQRLLEIADRCPVHRTLTGEVRISTTEVTD